MQLHLAYCLLSEDMCWPSTDFLLILYMIVGHISEIATLSLLTLAFFSPLWLMLSLSVFKMQWTVTNYHVMMTVSRSTYQEMNIGVC